MCHPGGVPFTYFAHQVPVLPLKSRWPDRWDGLGLVVGSIVPDLHYVTSGWVFGPFGIPLWSDGHRLDLIVQNCVLPGLVLTVLLRRALPTVAPALHDLGPAHVRDLALIGRARHRCDQATGHDRYGAGDQQRQASSPPV